MSELAAIGKRARKNGSSQLLNFYCTPTAPGRMRIFAHIGFFSSGKGTLPWFVENVLSRMPRWMTHLDAHDTLDGDNMLLHYQVCTLEVLVACECVLPVCVCLVCVSECECECVCVCARGHMCPCVHAYV